METATLIAISIFGLLVLLSMPYILLLGNALNN